MRVSLYLLSGKFPIGTRFWGKNCRYHDPIQLNGFRVGNRYFKVTMELEANGERMCFRVSENNNEN